MSKLLKDLHRRLRAVGISEPSTQKLLRDYSIPYLRQKVDVLAYIQSEQPGRIASPPNFLFKSIRDDYAPPAGYKSPLERRIEATNRAIREARFHRDRHQQEIGELAFWIKRQKEKAEFAVAARLAANMDPTVECELRQFINARNVSCVHDYNLRATEIERRKSDLYAGVIIEATRLDYFKLKAPSAFADITYEQVALSMPSITKQPATLVQKALASLLRSQP